MRTYSNQKGFTLIELICVAAIFSLLIALLSLVLLNEINKARGTTLTSEAHMAYIAAHTVIVENRGAGIEIEDEQYIEGLRGTVHDASLPVESRISEEINALIREPALSEEAGEDTAQVDFDVLNGEIIRTTYRKIIGSRLYTITLTNGETTIEFEKQ